MPGDFFGGFGLNFDGLLVEEMQLLHGFTVDGVLQGVHVLHDVQFQRRLLVVFCQT
jgi:hypothetical protein